MQVQLDVNQDAYAVGQHAVKLVAALKQAAADGVQISDLGAVAAAVVADLLPALADVNKLKVAAQSDLLGVISAGVACGLDLAKALAK